MKSILALSIAIFGISSLGFVGAGISTEFSSNTKPIISLAEGSNQSEVSLTEVSETPSNVKTEENQLIANHIYGTRKYVNAALKLAKEQNNSIDILQDYLLMLDYAEGLTKANQHDSAQSIIDIVRKESYRIVMEMHKKPDLQKKLQMV